MFIGKWNKSVILTYIGLFFSVFGIYLSIAFNDKTNYALSCLIIAGVCDMFDGFVARKCKRTEEEKNFGIQIDSLVDVVDFIAFPIILFFSLGLNSWYHVLVAGFFAICGVARLGYFNINLEDNGTPVKYYSGLPVTAVAIIYPLIYLLKYFVNSCAFGIFYTVVMFLNAVFNILNIKIRKPKGIAYAIFSALAVIVLVLYLGVL